ncbi:protein LITTLE ZIPPER 4 [Zea mays]|jgi:hypothetical protein|uniref:Protein LITTLE ZIPPER 4 n=1 Tax=Zea mays TaxID=4577 RepID=K7UBQ2_MAIZE|nr:protein LITTLE ZIPPER 4 [Zea mays]AQK39276.1 hypothetical protein ZEAMMB73_Zm00001d023405 [Zea mays]|eukprot:XP_008662465.1 protein LITTLE ZIPPER 4 [Zea mays]
MERAENERLRRVARQLDQGNTSLCLENLLIMQENDRLRRKAQQLDQENKALLAELKQREQGTSASASTNLKQPK